MQHLAPAYLHDLVLKLWQEEINDLEFLDGQGVQVDFLHALDLASLDQPTKFRDRLPLLLLRLIATTARSTASTTTVPATSAVSTRAKATAPTISSSCSSSCRCWRRCISHGCSFQCLERDRKVFSHVWLSNSSCRDGASRFHDHQYSLRKGLCADWRTKPNQDP